jgi:hypothetical protein
MPTEPRNEDPKPPNAEVGEEMTREEEADHLAALAEVAEDMALDGEPVFVPDFSKPINPIKRDA